MGKPVRLALTILLFLGLGLATSIAIAWGAHAHLMATETISKSGVTTKRWFGVSLYRGVSTTEQGVTVWRLPDDGKPPTWSNLRHPPRDNHLQITVLESGWPWRCLGGRLDRYRQTAPWMARAVNRGHQRPPLGVHRGSASSGTKRETARCCHHRFQRNQR